MLIQVTRDDIRNGQPSRATKCPVALAINRAIHNDSKYCTAGVCGAYISVYILGKMKRYYTPEPVKDFIRAFDTGKHCEPFIFELDAGINPKPPFPVEFLGVTEQEFAGVAEKILVG